MKVTTSMDDGVGRVVLADPPLNILTRALLAELREQLATLAGEPALRVLLLQAEGPHFSAGASVPEHLPPACDAMIPEFTETIRALGAFPLPVIAAVRGRCLGGAFELVQAADLVIAADGALFGLPEIQLGVFPPAACALLPRLVGAGVAAELLYTGDALPATAVAAAGLVCRVVPDEALDDEAHALALRIARHSGAALRRAKRALRAASALDVDRGLAAAETIYLEDLMTTHDAVEGLQAFVEKRRPLWSHR
jgi:cyclohexa-1,5-dienecarbonyl-CoA hydratase